MTSIRRTSTALVVAAALGLPSLALAETPYEACDGEKTEHKQPTAERDKPNNNENKTEQRASEPKSGTKSDDNKTASNQTGRQS